MKKIFRGFCAAGIFMALIFATGVKASYAAPVWPAEGVISGTDIEYAGLSVSAGGVSVRLTNTAGHDVKVSLRLTFLDRNGNTLGYSIFGLREIYAGRYVSISNNHLNGSWRTCRDAPRMVFSSMTYEPIYD